MECIAYTIDKEVEKWQIYLEGTFQQTENDRYTQ